MADRAGAPRAIHAAFRQRSFTRDWSRPGLSYHGLLDPNGLRVPVEIDVVDDGFVRPPRIRLREDWSSARRVPHILNDDRSLCYFEAGAVILDRYDAGGTVLQCLEQAERVLRDGVAGRLDTDFATEFIAYWSTASVFVDLPPDFVGHAGVRFVRLHGHADPKAVLTNGRSWLTASRSRRGRRGDQIEPCLVVRVGHPVSIDPDRDWPPDALPAFNDWLGWVDPGLVGRLEEAFRHGDRPHQWIGLAAPNGLHLARIQLPSAFQRQEFTTNRRRSISGLLGRIAPKVQVERFGAQRADTAYIFGRNMDQGANLAGKRILLVGCGTIGGFLAQQLCQAGAGSDRGRLVLVDKDVLRTANLGRHLLGTPYLDRNKATACADFLRTQLPMLDVVGTELDLVGSGLNMRSFDLVVDATGEEALSLAINDDIVRTRPRAPAALYVWLVGNGAAAQCLTVTVDHACLKCLKPDLAGQPRFRTLRKGVEVRTEQNLSCGDARYVPFPVSRSVAASALACEAILDWAKGSPEPRFRSLTLDRRRAFLVKDASPARSKRCPACGGARG